MDGARRLSWGSWPFKSTSPESPPNPSPTRFTPSRDVVALIVAGLHSGAALVLKTPETERHNLTVIATKPKDESQEERLRELALAVVHHESVYGLRGYAVSRRSDISSLTLEVCKANMIEVYSDGPKISETLSLCFKSMTNKLAYLVQVDYNNDDFQRELGGNIGLLAKLMIFPFKVALEVQHSASSVPTESFQTLKLQNLTFRGPEDLEFLVATTAENRQAGQKAEMFAEELIRGLEEQASAIKSIKSTKSEKIAKMTRNRRRGRGRSANKEDAGGEDLDRTAVTETASASPKTHLTTTTGTLALPTDKALSQSLERTYTGDSLSLSTALFPPQKVTKEKIESSQGHSRMISSLTELSRRNLAPSVLVSAKMSSKLTTTSPRTSRVLVATPLTPLDRKVSSPRTTASPGVQNSGSKKLGTSPTHTPSPAQSKAESIQLWKALRQSESPSLEAPGSGEHQTPLGLSSLEREEMSPAEPRLQSSVKGKERVTSLENAECDDEGERMRVGTEGWQVVESKQRRKAAKQSQSGHQRDASNGKPSSEHSEGKQDTIWTNKRDLPPQRPPPPSPAKNESKGRPKKKTGDSPFAPKVSRENFPVLPAPSVGPQPKLEAKTRTSSAPVGLSAAAQRKVEVQVLVPVVPLVSSDAPQRKIDAKAGVPIAPAASPRAPSPKVEVKEQTLIVSSPDVKDMLSAEAATSLVEHIHKEEAPETSSQLREGPSGKLTDIPEETILEAPLLEKPLNTTVSSQDKGKSKEPIVGNSPISPQAPSYLAPESRPESSDEQSLTENPNRVSQDTGKHKSNKSKKKRKQTLKNGFENQGMSSPKSAAVPGFDPHSSLPDSSGPSSSSTDAAASGPALHDQPPNPGYLPEMSGISYYYVPRGPPITLPARPELYMPPLTVPSWLGAPMVFNAAEPGPLPSTFSAITGRAMSGPMMSRVSHLGPIGAATATAAAAAGVPVGFVPRNQNEPLPSTVPNKPSHFVYRLDSTGWECAKQGCEKRTNDWDGYSMICQQCGPYSRIRYCSTEHVLKDAGAHHHICPVEPFRAPAVELPSRFEKLLPTIQNVNPPTHPLRTRQVVFNATNDASGYALFSDYIDFKKEDTPDNVANRASNAVGDVWHMVTFEEKPQYMDRLNRVLHAVFFDEKANGAAIVYLGRMIRENLRDRGLWNAETQNQLQYQFMGEFKFTMLNDIFSKSYRDNCWTEWTGHSARYCEDEICRYELCNPALPYGDQTYGRGIQQHVEAMEAYHWILRAWRVFHPTIKNVDDRIKGIGFQGVPDEQKGKLRGRGEGWDGYGNVGDERCS